MPTKKTVRPPSGGGSPRFSVISRLQSLKTWLNPFRWTPKDRALNTLSAELSSSVAFVETGSQLDRLQIRAALDVVRRILPDITELAQGVDVGGETVGLSGCRKNLCTGGYDCGGHNGEGPQGPSKCPVQACEGHGCAGHDCGKHGCSGDTCGGLKCGGFEKLTREQNIFTSDVWRQVITEIARSGPQMTTKAREVQITIPPWT